MTTDQSRKSFEALRKAILYRRKDYPKLGDCEWNRLTMEGFQEVLKRLVQAARQAELKVVLPPAVCSLCGGPYPRDSKLWRAKLGKQRRPNQAGEER